MNSTLQPISLPQPQVSLSPLHFAQNSPDFRPLFSIASALRIRQRMRILSDHRESKDSSPVPPFARSLHKERFRTLLETSASALFHFPYPVTPLFATLTKTAGCVPTIPKMEHSALPERIFHESANL